MKKRFLIIFIAFLVIPIAGLAAQEGAFTLMSFDIGYGPAMSTSGGSLQTINTFGINVRVAGPMCVGFVSNTGGLTYSSLKIKFDVRPQVRAVFGYGAGNRVGLGFEIIPFRRQASGLFTEFKIAPEYTFTDTTVTSGTLIFPLTLGIGF